MNLKEILLELPDVLNAQLEPQEALHLIQNKIKARLNADFAMIAYLSSNGIDIKDISDFDNTKIEFHYNNIAGFALQTFLKNKKTTQITGEKGKNTILNELGIKIKKSYSLLILPLNIKEAVFGVIFCVRFNNKKPFSEEEIIVAQALSSIGSYIVKDAELSNVFKLQLKMLNENVIEKTHAIENVREENDKIREADKIKSEFLANMSHALRTPLNAIISFSEALDMEIFGNLNAKQQDYVLEIQNSGKEMLALVNDLLDMSKIKAKAMKIIKLKFDAKRSILEVINVVNSLALKKEITIFTKLPAAKIEVTADEQKFDQIMYNLLSNAIKFTDKKGKIEVGIKKSKNKILFYVKDNGIGIDEKYHGKIFGKFEQVDSSYSSKYSSTGLGLTITKELVEMHGGKIWLESRLNNGTTFWFELPA
ncbi:MAG: GAF domain-containing sensor histidine kinase [Candidatus Gastranaerophilales bacterium]|nr:GAF domain-containing sensor histidine kinase [Candidatus Gastranaerophilales bacterium]